MGHGNMVMVSSNDVIKITSSKPFGQNDVTVFVLVLNPFLLSKSWLRSYLGNAALFLKNSIVI